MTQRAGRRIAEGVLRGLRRITGGILKGLASVSGLIAVIREVSFGDSGSPLRLPGFWDRMVVMLVGLVMVTGLVALVNALRRRADRRERNTK